MGVSRLTFEIALHELMEDSASSASGGDATHPGSNNQTPGSYSQCAFNFGIQNGGGFLFYAPQQGQHVNAQVQTATPPPGSQETPMDVSGGSLVEGGAMMSVAAYLENGGSSSQYNSPFSSADTGNFSSSGVQTTPPLRGGNIGGSPPAQRAPTPPSSPVYNHLGLMQVRAPRQSQSSCH